jgi:acid phosphatase (class A)
MKNCINLRSFCLFLLAAAFAAATAGCAAHQETNKRDGTPPGFHSGLPVPPLPDKKLPDSLTLLPPPPAAGSTAFALDEEFSRRGLALRGTPAWDLAILDANLDFQNAAATYSCALNAPVTRKDTPHLFWLLMKSMKYAADSTITAKHRYNRRRPFTMNKAPICTPHETKDLKEDGSYPSGHNAIGMVWALILAEISPENADAILARAQAYGMGRIVCNVHWYSDTLQGRYMGAYTAAVLHADPSIRNEIKASREELAAVRAKGLPPVRDCAAEARGMEMQKALFK